MRGIRKEQGRECVRELDRHQFVKEAQEAKGSEEVEKTEFEGEGYEAIED